MCRPYIANAAPEASMSQTISDQKIAYTMDTCDKINTSLKLFFRILAFYNFAIKSIKKINNNAKFTENITKYKNYIFYKALLIQ